VKQSDGRGGRRGRVLAQRGLFAAPATQHPPHPRSPRASRFASRLRSLRLMASVFNIENSRTCTPMLRARLLRCGYLATRIHARTQSARPAIPHFKIRTPSGAVNGACHRRERRGGPWGGVFPSRGPGGAHLPVRRQVASDERSGPRAAGKSALLDASLEYTEFVAAGVAVPAGGVRAMPFG